MTNTRLSIYWLPFCLHAAHVGAADLVLLNDRVSAYQIAIPDTFANDAMAECLKQTARLMQVAFQANGAEVAVVAESDRDKAKPTIFLGDT